MSDPIRKMRKKSANKDLSLGQFFAIKSKIKNIVFLINLKAKKVFFKALSRFNKIVRTKNSKS